MIRYFIKNTYFALLFLSLNSAQLVIARDQRVIAISIYKSGTHLLQQVLEQMTGKEGRGTFQKPDSTTIPQSFSTISIEDLRYLQQLPNNFFWMTHLIYTDELKTILEKPQNCIFFIYRDPRDQIISHIFHYLQLRPEDTTSHWFTTPFNDLVAQLSKNIRSIYGNNYMPWMKLKNVCAIKFEDLVGSRGGGSDSDQMTTLIKIANHLGLSFSETELSTIADNIFGKGPTFRKGQIGEWKKYFNDNLKNNFKRYSGHILIDLGYESNLDW